MGIRGLALATAVASIVNVYVSLWFLRKYIRLPSGKIYKEVIKTIIAAMTGCFAAYLCLLNLKMDNPYISIITAIAICSILYGAIMYFTKSESMELSIRYIKKLGKTR
jgi:peptidoglycan biosynthesis protein MviN/MurJ (putative lipid II flippase)